MSNTQKSNSGCFSGILRRLLCQGSHQTYPSDQMTEPKEPDVNESKKEQKREAESQTLGAPGIVARLMGLESLPETNPVRKGRAPESVNRSKSVNFMDYLLQFDLAQAHQHRQVRTSLSFREVPTLSYLQNPELFVLYLEEEDEKEELKVRKYSEDFEVSKQKKKERGKNNKESMKESLAMKKEKQRHSKKFSKFIDEPRRNSVKHHSNVSNSKGAKDLNVVLPSKRYGESNATLKRSSSVKKVHQREVLAKPKVTKSKDKHSVERVVAAECSSENSSPISVLDVNDFSVCNDNPSSEDARCMDMNSDRFSSLKTDYPSSNSNGILSNDELMRRAANRKDCESMDNIQITDCYKEMMAKLCGITEEAVMQANWMSKKVLNFEDFEEICMQFGQQILDALLQQVVDELMESNVEDFA